MSGSVARWRGAPRWIWATTVLVTVQAWACDVPVARVASVQGAVELRRGEAAWQRLQADQPLCAGDIVRVGEHSRAALLMRNQTTLRLDQSTQLTLLAQEAAGATVIEQLKGIVNVITRTPRPFRLGTPFVNANVEGTEFMVQVDERESTVRVVEGRVIASNPVGQVALGAGEQARGDAQTLPAKAPALRPTDAVQWALHYPLLRPAAGRDRADVRDAAARRDAGRPDDAITLLRGAPAPARDGGWRVQLAALLLEVGRADEAAPLLAAVPAGDPARAEALALQAIVALARNEAAAALVGAEAALAADPRAVVPRIAASYVRQSRFDLDGAARDAREAVALDASNALAWSRVAELALFAGDVATARDAAARGVQQDASVGRVQAVHGFTLLAAHEGGAALDAFARAMQADPGDPMPQLGRGLALIRAGRLAEGREAIEIAVSLDPENALLRSMLGKAYAQERRSKQAQVQYGLAQQRDPLDPTPWFYAALDKVVNGQPVEALADAERSIALNDNRAVYRSRLLLDDDLAVRGAGLARIYDELGFRVLGVSEAAKALAADPSSASAHRFLADVYGSTDGHEAASVSELLQSRLLGAVPSTPVEPRRSWAQVLGLIDESVLGSPNDESRFFEPLGARGRLALAGGSRGLWSAEASATYLGERLGLSAGAFRYHTDGFRPNSDVTHRVDRVELQYALLPSLAVQAEWRRRHSELGDIHQNFDPDAYNDVARADIRQRSVRTSLVWRPAADTTLLLTHLRQQRDELQAAAVLPLELSGTADVPGHTTELQYRWVGHRANVVLGAASTRLQADTYLHVVDRLGILGGRCAPEAPCVVPSVDPIEESRGYAYVQWRPRDSLTATLGASEERRRSLNQTAERWHPKLGLVWAPQPALSLRAAFFGTTKRSLMVDQSIEPVQVAGFNQVYDDRNGVSARVAGLGADWRPRDDLRLSAELLQRRLEAPRGLSATDPTSPSDQRATERRYALHALWTPTARLALRAGLAWDRFARITPGVDDAPEWLRTTSLPMAVRYFGAAGTFAELAVTPVQQSVRRLPTSTAASGRERFTLVDAAWGLRLPDGQTSVTVTAKNLLGSRFRLQDDNFRTSELRQSRWLPVRSVVVALHRSF